MPRMRHPKVAGAYDAHEDQVSMLRMSGWLTQDEWERAELPDWEPEPEPEDEQDDSPDEPGEQTEAPRRTRQRATTKKEKD